MKNPFPCTAALLALWSLAPSFTLSADITSTWNGSTGNWSDATKWSSNPLFTNTGASTFDVIQDAGSLALDQAITIQKFNLSAGVQNGGGFTLTLNELLTLSGGTLGGTGTVQANGGVSFSGAGLKTVRETRTLNLS